jgi:dihydrofolate synthase/folylpolyglutamate synthase
LTVDGLTDLEKRYRDHIEWLFAVRRFGSKLGLDYVRHLLAQIGDPHEDFCSVHVTGTNGKGSTTAMIASILGEAEYKVGMFTSPHLSTFTERIQINGVQIPVRDVVRFIETVRPLCEGMAEDSEMRHPTFFEIITAIAFKYFSEEVVDYAVLEVGMGGRLDATNVVKSQVSVITNVSLEHIEVLGDTMLEIAKKKAGIIKEGGVLITATADDDVYHLFRETCESVSSKIFRVGTDITFQKLDSSYEGQTFNLKGLSSDYEGVTIPLIGGHQLLNAATAVGAVEALKFHGVEVSGDAIASGLKGVKWPGRMEVMQTKPLVVLDGAKDVNAAKAMKEALQSVFIYDRLVAVLSISSDKKIAEMIREIAHVADHFVITSHRVMGRAAKSSRIASEVERHSRTHEVIADVKTAVKRAIEYAGVDGMVIVVGSVFLVGEAREIWHEPSNPFSHLEY